MQGEGMVKLLDEMSPETGGRLGPPGRPLVGCGWCRLSWGGGVGWVRGRGRGGITCEINCVRLPGADKRRCWGESSSHTSLTTFSTFLFFFFFFFFKKWKLYLYFVMDKLLQVTYNSKIKYDINESESAGCLQCFVIEFRYNFKLSGKNSWGDPEDHLLSLLHEIRGKKLNIDYTEIKLRFKM